MDTDKIINQMSLRIEELEVENAKLSFEVSKWKMKYIEATYTVIDVSPNMIGMIGNVKSR